jgi:hypothetical protein
MGRISTTVQHSLALFPACLALLIAVGCNQPGKVTVVDGAWWKDRSQPEIIDIVYQSYCKEQPDICLPKEQYEVGFSIPHPESLIVVFEAMEGGWGAGISCYATMQKSSNGALSCAGSRPNKPYVERRDYPLVLPQ